MAETKYEAETINLVSAETERLSLVCDVQLLKL